MDTTEKYIRMSDCPEIQDHWNPSEGDVYASPRAKFPSIYGGACLDFVENNDIWLPRQDQIQVFLRQFYAKDSGRPDDWFPTGSVGLTFVMRKFHKFTIGPTGESSIHANEASSFEQLWLQLYMYEAHDKIWVDEKGWTL